MREVRLCDPYARVRPCAPVCPLCVPAPSGVFLPVHGRGLAAVSRCGWVGGDLRQLSSPRERVYSVLVVERERVRGLLERNGGAGLRAGGVSAAGHRDGK